MKGFLAQAGIIVITLVFCVGMLLAGFFIFVLILRMTEAITAPMEWRADYDCYHYFLTGEKCPNDQR